MSNFDVSDLVAQIKEKYGGKMPLDQIMFNLCEASEQIAKELDAGFQRRGILPLSKEQRAAVYQAMIHAQAECLANFFRLSAGGADLTECLKLTPNQTIQWLKNFIQ